ncbi:MAG TPA: hypothetical protein G4O00_10735 [Thermoflexia bacterium]|nr:hypothetical protein [Thermoflexia bacterium]
MKGKRWIVWLFLTIFLLMIPSTALAAGQTGRLEGRRWVVRGEVTAVTPPTLTVQTDSGPVVVMTDGNTRFRIPGVSDPSLEDIQVGDHVICAGRRGEDGFHAVVVVVVDPEARAARVGGQVVSVDGSDISISTPAGESILIRTDADTRFRIPGVEDPGPDDVEVGSLIGAAGKWEEDGVFRASIVVVPRAAERRGRVTGEVVGIEGTTLVLQTKGGRQARLITDEGTAFHVPGVEGAALADVNVGDRVTAEVMLKEGVLYATQVVVWPEQPARLGGEVAAIDGATIVLETPHGTVQVLTDGSTIFRVPGVEDPSLVDVQVGDRVGCGGEWKDEGTFHASVVVVRRGRPAPGRSGTVRGRVLSVGGDRLTVGTSRGPVTVIADEGTTIRVPGVEHPTLSDIHPGDVVGARGRWNEDGSLQAEGVAVLGGGERPPHGSGGPKVRPKS